MNTRLYQQKTNFTRNHTDRSNRIADDGFRCAHCHSYVYTNQIISGVVNRNHCPYCLWSRHLDLFQPGDRLAACMAIMQPIGLTFKKIHKKYGSQFGEMMLIHQCRDCGKLSINRIAADDDAQRMLEIYESSLSLQPAARQRIVESGVHLLEASDLDSVRAQLFGRRTSIVE